MSETTVAAGFATLAIHAGAQPDLASGFGAMPFSELPGSAFGNSQTDGGSPACAALEERIAVLEGGTAAVAVVSAAAARLVTFQTLLQPGDEIVAVRRQEGGMSALRGFGWHVRFAETGAPESFVEALGDRTKAILVHSIDDRGRIADIEAIAAIARRARVPLVVDNTLATPYLVRPFEHGADIVLHAAPGLLGGGGARQGGLIVDGGSFIFAGDERFPALSQPLPCGTVIAESFGNYAFATGCRALGLSALGAMLSPLDAFLMLNGIETLPLRMRRHCDTALAVAAYLARHSAVDRVRYAGLPCDVDHALMQHYCPNGAGALVGFRVGGEEAGAAFVKRLMLFSQTPHVGDTRSLAIVQPGADGLVRLSIGLEDQVDVIADLDQALAR